MKALILAAGYATRLYPLTKEYPKPLLEVEKRPIIDYIFDKLSAVAQIDEIIVVTNSKFVYQFKEWAAQKKSRQVISVVDDLTTSNEDRLGAIGDINFAVEHVKIDEDLLVVGGDNLFDGDLNGLLVFAKNNAPHPVIGVYDIQDVSHASRYGVVHLNDNSKVIDFREKPSNPESSLVAMCLYFFPKERLGLIGEYLASKAQKRDATGFYIDWLRNRVPVFAYTFHGRWYDIGDHKFYNEANKQFNKNKSRI